MSCQDFVWKNKIKMLGKNYVFVQRLYGYRFGKIDVSHQ
jgi:hypothetical protein